jgi:CMP-N-acetylneuraminic acid synthetase
MFAYIPARGGSKRVPGKNVKLLGGKPVLARVIGNLRALDFLSAIYVSTDDRETAKVAEEAGAQCLGFREPALANDISGFMDLIRDDIPRYMAARGDDEVLFALSTAALVPPSVFREAWQVWRRKSPDILMSCERAFPWWDMVEKPDGFWAPLYPDKVTVNSQDLPRALVDAGLFYFFRQPRIAEFETVKSADRVLPFVVSDRYLGDIDTPEDWDLLEYRFAKLAGPQ